MANKPEFLIRQCERTSCRFRFPVAHESGKELSCPRCGAPTWIAHGRFHGRENQPWSVPPGPEVEALLDNIRSSYNVGSMFRTADGAGIRRLHLSGISATPLNPKVAKTALGAEQSVCWSHHSNGLETAIRLKRNGYRLWALEENRRSRPLFELEAGPPGFPVLLVVGNELAGVDPGILDICDQILAIPMQGSKGSLNVVVAFGVAAYFVRYGIDWTMPGQRPARHCQ